MATSQNGWSVEPYGSGRLRRFKIPARTGTVYVTLRDGSAGFLLAHFLLWYAETIEPLVGRIIDDWGHAVRMIRGQDDDYSNHASGTAADHNATRHPLGVIGTFTRAELEKIGDRLMLYRGCLRHGAFYRGRVDPMHVEIDRELRACEKRARQLMRTPRGVRLLAANPGLRRVILS